MIKKVVFAVVATVCFALISCEKIKDIFSFNDCVEVTVKIEQDALKATTVKVQSLAESVELCFDTATSVPLHVFRNGKPQIIAVTDADNHLLMMYRGPVSKGDVIDINPHTTTNAMVSFNPLYGPVPSDDYDQMIAEVEASPYYSDFANAVNTAIRNGFDLADSSNAQVLAMMYNLLRDLSEKAFGGQAAIDSVIVAKGSSLNLFPLLVEEKDNELVLRTSSNCPSYYGALLDADSNVIQEIAVTAAPRYGFMDCFSGEDNPNSYGTPVSVPFTTDGVYTIVLSCTEESAIIDFYIRFVNNILASLGADVNPSIVSAIAPYVRHAANEMDIDVTSVSSADAMRLIVEGYDVVVDYLRTRTNILNGEGNWDLVSTLLHRLNEIYASIQSTTEAMLCTSWNFVDEEAEGDRESRSVIRRRFIYITTVSYDRYKLIADASLRYHSGNNQRGKAYQPLQNDIVVKLYNAHDENGNYIHSNNREVKFVASSGNGTFGEENLSEIVVETSINGYASTRWTLGGGTSGNTQHCYAVAIDSEGNEISNKVYFTALTSNDRYRISLCCDWADHTNYASQFDVDLTLASGGTGTVSLANVSGPQWDYNGYSERYEMSGTYNTNNRHTDMEIAMYMGVAYGGWHFRTDLYSFTLQNSGVAVPGTLIYDGFDHGSPYGAGCGSYIWVEKLGSDSAPINSRRPQNPPKGKVSLVAKK